MMPPRVRTPLLSLLVLQADLAPLLRNRYRSASGDPRVLLRDYFPRGSSSCRTWCCRCEPNPNGRRRGSRFVDDKALGVSVTDTSGARFDRSGAWGGGAYILEVQWWGGGQTSRRNKMSGAVAAETPQQQPQPQRLKRLKSFTATTRNWIFNRKDIRNETESLSLGLGLTSQRSFSSASKMGFHDSSSFTNVLDSNAHWREKITKRNPDLLPSLATGQSPTILWLGCSDSRCPETTILGLQPGDVFVHRNIANILHAGDINSNAVIEYAVRHLGVKHVVLSGHTGCGGVAAALGNAKVGGVLDVWLAPLRKLRKEFAGELGAMGEKEKAIRLVELNVLAGVQTLKEKDVVIEARRKGELQIHGVVYEVGTGVIRELEIPVDEVAEEKTVEAFALKE